MVIVFFSVFEFTREDGPTLYITQEDKLPALKDQPDNADLVPLRALVLCGAASPARILRHV